MQGGYRNRKKKKNKRKRKCNKMKKDIGTKRENYFERRRKIE